MPPGLRPVTIVAADDSDAFTDRVDLVAWSERRASPALGALGRLAGAVVYTEVAAPLGVTRSGELATIRLFLWREVPRDVQDQLG